MSWGLLAREIERQVSHGYVPPLQQPHLFLLLTTPRVSTILPRPRYVKPAARSRFRSGTSVIVPR
jgi:hypothetical protein